MATFGYNPITGQLDLVGAGASYIDGVVANPSLLPTTLGTPALDAVYLAKAGSGVWLINRRPGGLYCRVANNGNANDWQHLGAFPEVNADGNWELYNSADPTKELKFDLSGLPTATTRTVNAPDGNGKMLVEGQSIGATTRNTGAFTTLNANTQIVGPQGTAVGSSSAPAFSIGASNSGIYVAGNQLVFTQGGTDRAYFDNTGRLFLTGTGGLSIGATGTGINFTRSVSLNPDATGTLAQRSTTQAQTFQIYNTTDGPLTNFERGFMRWSSNVLQIGTEKAGTGSARALEFQTDGTTRLTISEVGGFSLATGLSLTFASRAGISAPALGSFRLLGTDGSSFNFLYLGVQSASYPALKRVGTALQIRLGDDSADAPLSCGAITASGALLRVDNAGATYPDIGSNTYPTNGNNGRFGTAYVRYANVQYDVSILSGGAFGLRAMNTRLLSLTDKVFDFGAHTQVTGAHTLNVYNVYSGTTSYERARLGWAANEFIIDAEAGSGGGTLRGIKIGSATSSLLGFYGATPVTQRAAIADATDAATTQARLNDLLAAMRSLGLIAT